MASNIQSLLNDILNAVYGRDVRDAIHDAIEICYDDVESGRTTAETAALQVDTAVNAATAATNAANAAANDASSAATAASTAASNVSSAINSANQAAVSASNAANSASAAASNAASAATAANEAVTAANQAVDEANEAISEIRELDVDVDLILNAIDNANAATSAANTAADNAIAAKNAATAAAENANAKATAANTAANSATTAAQAANTATTNANTARDAANTAATNANNARDAAATATSAANTATTNANAATASANTATANANAKITAMDSKIFDAGAAISNATTAANAANVAATSANSAASSINDLTVDSEDVGPSTPASAVLQTVSGHKNIHFLLRQGAPGSSYIIKGDAYATVQDLASDITNPAIGDQYNVGSAPPYHVYRWTGTTWEDQGIIGSESNPFSGQDVQLIYDHQESQVEDASTKVMKYEALTYLLQTLLGTLLNGKVDKVTGKGLSTNDFTDDLAQKLGTAYNYAMDFITSKVDTVAGKGLSTNDLTDALLTKITLIGDGTLTTTAQTLVAAVNELVSGKAPLNSPVLTGTPMAPTPTANDDSDKIATTAFVNDTVDAKVLAGLDGKVDKVTGKGLSTNDYTTAEKNKLSGIAAGADVSPSPFASDPAPNGTASAGSSANYSRGDHVHPTDTTRQEKNLYFNASAPECTVSTWTLQSSPTVSGYPYRADIAISDVTSNSYAIVTFTTANTLSGKYAPLCATHAGGVYIYSKVDTAITLNSIAVFL